MEREKTGEGGNGKSREGKKKRYTIRCPLNSKGASGSYA
jgi:hypothetical protein